MKFIWPIICLFLIAACGSNNKELTNQHETEDITVHLGEHQVEFRITGTWDQLHAGGGEDYGWVRFSIFSKEGMAEIYYDHAKKNLDLNIDEGIPIKIEIIASSDGFRDEWEVNE